MRSKAAQKYRFVDDVLALDELLTRWHVDSNSSAADRRVALNLARHDALSQQAHPDETQQAPNIRWAATTFPFVRFAQRKSNPATTTSTANLTPTTSRPQATTTTTAPWRTCDHLCTAISSNVSRPSSAPLKISLTRKEDWEIFVYAADRDRPESLTKREISALSTKALRTTIRDAVYGTPTSGRSTPRSANCCMINSGTFSTAVSKTARSRGAPSQSMLFRV